MMRNTTVLIAVAIVAGCRAPAPSFNVFAPYGSSRVPPPQTGAINPPNSYYQTPAQPITPVPSSGPAKGANPPTLGAASTGSLPGFVGVGNQAGGGVAPASYQSPVVPTGSGAPNPVLPTATPTKQVIPPAPSTNKAGSGGSTLKLKGMPVNDATLAATPQSALPPRDPVELSHLPPANANRSPALLHIINPKPGTNPTTPPVSPTPATGNSWQAR